VAKKLYVGNLSYDTSDSKLQEMFEVYGTPQAAAAAITADDGESRRLRG